MAAMNELKAVHMPSEEHREFRSLVKYRKTLDYRINKMKCTIRAWFVNHGISIDSGEKAWHSGRELINSFRKKPENQRLPQIAPRKVQVRRLTKRSNPNLIHRRNSSQKDPSRIVALKRSQRRNLLQPKRNHGERES
jgi:hypothetical protein